MRWHSEHGMGHLWAPQNSPTAGARRYGHGLTRRRTREKTGRRTRLVVVFTLNRTFYPTSSAVPPVSFLILHPKEIQFVWSQTETEKKKN